MLVVSLLSFLPKGGALRVQPPGRNTVGMSSLAAAMSMPGMILSQLASSTRPSSRCARAWISTASAMFSREGST